VAHEAFKLPVDPTEAVAALQEHSRTGPVLVFKKSPICAISQMAEQDLEGWLAQRSDGPDLKLVTLDVLADRALARGLTAELDIAHQSPQALLFAGGELRWHASHDGINGRSLSEHVDGPQEA
jgi:bacillithiol system protein YtxJ